jgi:hypothetical protein
VALPAELLCEPAAQQLASHAHTAALADAAHAQHMMRSRFVEEWLVSS